MAVILAATNALLGGALGYCIRAGLRLVPAVSAQAVHLAFAAEMVQVLN